MDNMVNLKDDHKFLSSWLQLIEKIFTSSILLEFYSIHSSLRLCIFSVTYPPLKIQNYLELTRDWIPQLQRVMKRIITFNWKRFRKSSAQALESSFHGLEHSSIARKYPIASNQVHLPRAWVLKSGVSKK